jgi:hypothetical protein
MDWSRLAPVSRPLAPAAASRSSRGVVVLIVLQGRGRAALASLLIHIETDEEAAFWDWACVETLRHSGVRIEELCELTHLSIRQENPK